MKKNLSEELCILQDLKNSHSQYNHLFSGIFLGTMLHRAIQKSRSKGKAEIVQTLLDRGANVAARDFEGSSPRDYITIYGLDNAPEISRVIDNHILELAANDRHYTLESLLLEGYDHIVHIRGTKRNKSAKEIAEMKEYKDTMQLFKEFHKYEVTFVLSNRYLELLLGSDDESQMHASFQHEIKLLHDSARKGDLTTISKLAGEKRCAWSKY